MKSVTPIICRLIMLVSLAGFLTSCNVTKNLDDHQHLLIKNKIQIKNQGKSISAGDLESLIQQKPNKRFLGIIPIKLWFHSLFKKSGEPPVILDRSLIEESKTQIRSYLSNSGYYDSEISHEVLPTRRNKRKAKVKYEVRLSEPYRISKISYRIEDDSIRNLVNAYQNDALVDSGNIFNSFVLDRERARITDILNNNGYFGFTKDYIYYEADSTVGHRMVELAIRVRDPVESALSVDSAHHKIYYLNNITIYPDYHPFAMDTVMNDTLVKITKGKNEKDHNKFNIVYNDRLKIRPQVILRSMFLENHEKYSQLDANQSYRKLNELRIFKYADINFRESSTPKPNTGLNYLDVYVRLTRNPVHSYSIEAQGTNSGGDLGIGGYFGYQNKNLFKGGEVLSVRLKGAMEAQEQTVTTEIEKEQFLFFNTFEVGVEATLYIPKFLAPVDEDLFSKYFRPKTSFSIGYNIQNRIEYDRIITNLSFGYEWSETRFKQHILYPIDINVVKVNTTPEFDDILSNESQRFQNQYTDHLILGLRYSYTFNNQEINKVKDFLYFRGNFESSGNLLNLAVQASDQDFGGEKFKTVFGIRYSQYIKVNFDIRYYFRIDRERTLALRTFTGLAVPYGNSEDIPFEKGYFGGGANGMRAWPLRYLGPGGFQNTGVKTIERVGDIMLEANVEYRFPIYNVFTGALFYDVGNIWLISENETFPGGQFFLNRFTGQLAMDIGLGIRLDFNYFIFRIDFAQRLKDPALPVNDRWVIGNKAGWLNPVINLGIGYPF